MRGIGGICGFLPLDKKFPKWELGSRTARFARRTLRTSGQAAEGSCPHIELRRYPKLGGDERESEDGAAGTIGRAGGAAA